MKKILFTILLLFIGIEVNAQFSETFFNGLNAQGTDYRVPDKVDGIPVSGGFLGVLIADSAGTNIQFVKMEYNGRIYQTYSSTIPSILNPSDLTIINTYQTNNHTYIVTADYVSGKLIVLHYINYVYSDYSQISTALNKPYIGSNFDNVTYTIAVYSINPTAELRRYAFDLTTFGTPSNLLVEAFVVPNNMFKVNPQFFVKMGSNENLYYCNSGKLLRAVIQNNTVLSIDTLLQKCQRIFGLYTESSVDYMMVLDSAATCSRYLMQNNVLTLPSVSNYSYPDINSNNYNLYSRYQGMDFWCVKYLAFGLGYDMKKMNDLGVTIDSSFFHLNYTPKRFTVDNGKVFCAGLTNKFFEHGNTAYGSTLFLSWDNIEKIMDFKEISSFYSMGRFNLSTAYGPQVFADLTNAGPALKVDSLGRATDFVSTYLIAGKDVNGTIRGDNGMLFNNNFLPGPYTNYSQYSQTDLHHYIESYYVDVYQIAEHIQHFQANGYIPPKGIFFWPGNGDVSKGQSAQLAPYVDLNGNGIYEPMLGEYPDFPGTRCILTLSHDPIIQNNTIGTGLEYYSYIYDFDCDDVAIKNTLFTKLVVKNRGGIEYDSLMIGMMNDFDIGGPIDDYCGSNVNLGMSYGYNGDDYDQSQGASRGFNDIIPAQGYAILKGSKLDNDGIDNAVGVGTNKSVNGYGFGDGIVDNESWGMESANPFYHSDLGLSGINDDPNDVITKFLMMTCRWKDSTHFTCGSTGSMPSAIPCKYIYPGASDPMNYGTYGMGSCGVWGEITNSNQPGDRRNISATNRYRLMPDSTFVFESAFILGDGGATIPDGINNLFANTQLIRQYFHDNHTPCGQSFGNNGNILPFLSIVEEAKDILTLYPNPTNGMINVKGLKGDETIRIVDYSGRILMEIKNSKEIDLSSFSTGIYIVQITNETQTQSFKVVKN